MDTRRNAGVKRWGGRVKIEALPTLKPHVLIASYF